MPMRPCKPCNARGRLFIDRKDTCDVCNGSGTYIDMSCPYCKGKGWNIIQSIMICNVCDGKGCIKY